MQPGSINQYTQSANADKNIYQTKSTEILTDTNGKGMGKEISKERKVHKSLPNYRTSFPKTPPPD